MNSAIRWLRASYITGAVADSLIGFLMLIPGRMGEAEFRYPMGLGWPSWWRDVSVLCRAGITVRLTMQRRGIQIGRPKTLAVNYVF